MDIDKVVEFIRTMKRVILEAENLLELLEEDSDCNLRWIDEKTSLEETIEEAKQLLWPRVENDDLPEETEM